MTLSDGDGFSPRGVENVQDNAILPVKCESNFGGKKSKKLTSQLEVALSQVDMRLCQFPVGVAIANPGQGHAAHQLPDRLLVL